VQATALLASHPMLRVETAVYLLALRHPAVVARQLATISEIAPGRLTFGVGVGGDDPRELLEPYLHAGCRRFNFVPEAGGLDAAFEYVAAVKTHLTGAVVASS
jgi:alkanesulfonate monooxygenase SsuD/methylene tetrahydromethanopterin reductase-like flavin-dependent oxidoreductase (luciferase family)